MFSKFKSVVFWMFPRRKAIYESGDLIYKLINMLKDGKLTSEEQVELSKELTEFYNEWMALNIKSK